MVGIGGGSILLEGFLFRRHGVLVCEGWEQASEAYNGQMFWGVDFGLINWRLRKGKNEGSGSIYQKVYPVYLGAGD